MHLQRQQHDEPRHQPFDHLHQVLDELEAAVDAVCSNDAVSVADATATLTHLASQHPLLVLAYRRTLVCVARVRGCLAEGPALLALLEKLGLSPSGPAAA